MEELLKKVKNLEKANSDPERIRILQEIGAKLINEYEIKVEDLTIQPLWVEAYYYNPKKFADCNTHMNENQKGHFGQLYFHKKGYGGFDICLSDSEDYYLSFLLKATLINGVFTKQTGVYEILKKTDTTKEKLEKEKNILIKTNANSTCEVCYAQRVGITKPCYRKEKLAIFSINALTKEEYDFKFARKSLEPIVKQVIEEYIADNPKCTEKECKIKCKELFGWVPDIVTNLVKELDQ